MPTTSRGPSSRPEGRAHRARVRQLLAPSLEIGARLPKAAWLGCMLGVDDTQALRHLRRVLAEDGISTETRLKGQRGIYVTSIGEGAI